MAAAIPSPRAVLGNRKVDAPARRPLDGCNLQLEICSDSGMHPLGTAIEDRGRQGGERQIVDRIVAREVSTGLPFGFPDVAGASQKIFRSIKEQQRALRKARRARIDVFVRLRAHSRRREQDGQECSRQNDSKASFS